MKTRYAITHKDRNNFRSLTWANQGRNFKDTLEEINQALKDFNQNNSISTLTQVFGPQAIGTFEVRPIQCYDNGDAMETVFDDFSDEGNNI